MCCYRINTDVLLANLLVNSAYPVSYSYDDIHNYLRFMTDKFPTYISTNLSEQALYDCADEFPEVFKVYKDSDGKVVVHSTDYKPNVDYFNSSYSLGLCNYIDVVTKQYLEE